MRITILGAGVCASHFIQGTGHNIYPPAFLVEWGEGYRLMFECSQGVQQRLEAAGHDYTSVRHIAISHAHPDHCAPIHFVQSVYCKGLFGDRRFIADDLHFYAPDSLIADFPALWKIHLPETEGRYFDRPKLALHPMSSGSSLGIGDARLRACRVFHGGGGCEAVAYRLETPKGVIAYSGDTGECQGIREIADGSDVFICEASARIGDRTASRGYGHLDPWTVGRIASEAGVKTLVLFHYTGLDADTAIADEVRRGGFGGEIILGKDADIIDVPARS